MKRRHFLAYSLFFTAGCAATTNSGQISAPSNQRKTLRFAVTDVVGMEELQNDYEPFRVALEEVLERQVEFFPTENLIAAAAALHAFEVDMVMAGPSEYVVIRAKSEALPVVSLTRLNYHSLIVTRVDSGIQALADLKGKTVGITEVGQTGGHIGGVKLLADSGLQPTDDYEMIALGSTGIWTNLQDGSVDAVVGLPHRYEQFLSTAGVSETEFPIIAEGAPLPNDVFVLNRLLEPAEVKDIQSRMLEQKDKLIAGLLATEGNQKFQGGTLVAANDSDYDMVREMYRLIGQDTYL